MAFESAFEINKSMDLKIKLERLRHENHLVTSDYLQSVDYTDEKHMK